jgi:hypothetical protein
VALPLRDSSGGGDEDALLVGLRNDLGGGSVVRVGFVALLGALALERLLCDASHACSACLESGRVEKSELMKARNKSSSSLNLKSNLAYSHYLYFSVSTFPHSHTSGTSCLRVSRSEQPAEALAEAFVAFPRRRRVPSASKAPLRPSTTTLTTGKALRWTGRR